MLSDDSRPRSCGKDASRQNKSGNQYLIDLATNFLKFPTQVWLSKSF